MYGRSLPFVVIQSHSSNAHHPNPISISPSNSHIHSSIPNPSPLHPLPYLNNNFLPLHCCHHCLRVLIQHAQLRYYPLSLHCIQFRSASSISILSLFQFTPCLLIIGVRSQSQSNWKYRRQRRQTCGGCGVKTVDDILTECAAS